MQLFQQNFLTVVLITMVAIAFDVCTQIYSKESTVDATTQTDSTTDDDGGLVDANVQTDDLAEVDTVDEMTQTDEIQSLTMSICGTATPQTNALHLMSSIPGVIQYPIEIFIH